MSLQDIFPELFPIISEKHLPLAHRPTTLLSLALTCYQIYGIIVPYLLYNDVRFAGDQSVSASTALNAKAQSVTKEDIQQRETFPSHCIHLCINSISKFGVFSPNSVLDILQNLRRGWTTKSLVAYSSYQQCLEWNSTAGKYHQCIFDHSFAILAEPQIQMPEFEEYQYDKNFTESWR